MMTITGTLRGQHFIIKKKGQLVLNILTKRFSYTIILSSVYTGKL